jgi:hypothetical protein
MNRPTYRTTPILNVYDEWIGLEMEHGLLVSFSDKYKPDAFESSLQLYE